MTAVPDDGWKCRQLTSRVAAHVCSSKLPFTPGNTPFLPLGNNPFPTRRLALIWRIVCSTRFSGIWVNVSRVGMLGLIHPHAARYISIPYVRWCMLNADVPLMFQNSVFGKSHMARVQPLHRFISVWSFQPKLYHLQPHVFRVTDSYPQSHGPQCVSVCARKGVSISSVFSQFK